MIHISAICDKDNSGTIFNNVPTTGIIIRHLPILSTETVKNTMFFFYNLTINKFIMRSDVLYNEGIFKV